jgi:hypothetical protein
LRKWRTLLSIVTDLIRIITKQQAELIRFLINRGREDHVPKPSSDAPDYSDREIKMRVAKLVKAGKLPPERAHWYEGVLKDERDGKLVVMRDEPVQPRMPRGPGQQQRRWNGSWFYWS